MVISHLSNEERNEIFGGCLQLLLLGLLGWPCVVNSADVYSTTTGNVRVNGSTARVDTAHMARKHDFGPSGGFVDPESHIPRVATIVAGGPRGNMLLSGPQILVSGIPGRAEWTPTAVVMANRYGEGPAGEPCRSHAASYPVEPDTPLVWILRVQLGDQVGDRYWQLLPVGRDPVLLWQLKAPGLQPSLAMVVDTDEADDTRLMLYFSQFAGSAKQIQRAGTIHGLSTETPIDVRIEAVLDERDIAVGGRGYWHVWVNGHLVVDRVGPTLTQSATEPHQWFFGIYRYLMKCPNIVARVTRWEKVRLERGDLNAGSGR